jgi:hypothetical protein
MKRENEMIVAAFCFVCVISIVSGFIGYAIGSRKPATVVCCEQSYKAGELPCNVPLWAVYNRNGVLEAVSAMRYNDGTIWPFAIDGNTVPYEMLEPPDGWTELTAQVRLVFKGDI